MTPAVLCAWTVYLATQSVASLQDPRPASLVVDQAAILDGATEARIDTTLLALRTATGVEVALVTVDDVDGTPKAFATALFNHWQLGSAAKNDGVLVLMVMGQRRLEIETGDGVEGALPAWWLSEMQADRMVPRFKAKDFGGGLEAGVMAIAQRVQALPGETERDVKPGEYHSDGVVTTPPAGAATTGGEPAGPGPQPAVTTPGSGGGSSGTGLFAVLAGLGVIGVGGGAAFAIGKRRRHCARCKRQMLALDEVADDQHLDAGQRTEESIGSVNYEVLICAGCQQTRTLRHGRWFSGKSKCDSCGYKTETSTSTTEVSATYDHGGRVRVTETCAHCNRHHSYTRSTSRLTRPSSSSSSSSSSRSSSSSSSRSSGGRSSGGGAGSSW